MSPTSHLCLGPLPQLLLSPGAQALKAGLRGPLEAAWDSPQKNKVQGLRRFPPTPGASFALLPSLRPPPHPLREQVEGPAQLMLTSNANKFRGSRTDRQADCVSRGQLAGRGGGSGWAFWLRRRGGKAPPLRAPCIPRRQAGRERRGSVGLGPAPSPRSGRGRGPRLPRGLPSAPEPLGSLPPSPRGWTRARVPRPCCPLTSCPAWRASSSSVKSLTGGPRSAGRGACPARTAGSPEASARTRASAASGRSRRPGADPAMESVQGRAVRPGRRSPQASAPRPRSPTPRP